jgi:hypothetical protein
MTRHNIILLRDTDGSRPMSARTWQRVMVLIQEWRIRQISLEDYPDIYDLPYDDISEASSDFNEVIFDEQEPEPERDQYDSPRAEDYQ